MFKLVTKSLPSLKFGSLSLILGIVAPATFSLPTEAVVGGGRTFFVQAPRLVDATATGTPGAPSIYTFTLAVPEDAGKPLQAVRITQKPHLEKINFNPREIHASIEGSIARRDLSISSIGGRSPNEEEITIVFDEPVQPGSTVAVSLQAMYPLNGGIHQFGVTAFPIGDGSPGLYLGSARLTFPGSQ